VETADYQLDWIIQPDTITINDGTSDVFTTSDPALVAGGCYDAGVVATDTTWTVTASFTGGDGNAATASLVTGSDGSSYEEIIRADDPLAYYRFEEAAGSIAIFDSSGNHHHSIDPVGAPGGGLGTPGVIGNSWIADGTAAWRVPAPLNPQDPDGDDGAGDIDPDDLEGFTLEALVRAEDAGRLDNQPIFQQEDIGGTGRSALSLNLDGAPRTFYGGYASVAEDSVFDASWTHVAVTVIQNDIDYTLRFYIDGVQAHVDDIFLVPEPSTGAWRLGVDKTDGSFWIGSLDEMAFYAYPLDDPNFDGDTSDSRLPAHVQAMIANTGLGILGFGATDEIGDSDGVVTDGAMVALQVKVGGTAATVEVDNGVGPVTPVDGFATVMVNPPVGTTTYTLTVNGSETSTTDVIVLPPIAVTDLGVNANLFTVTAVNLVPGADYDLYYSPDLDIPFSSVGDLQTAPASSTLIFADPIPYNPELTPRIFYRVVEVPPVP
jgi:hypothetical protein